MNPQIWGPHAWIFLHSITLSYPDHPTIQDKTNTKNFFISLKNILPCYKCRNNYLRHLDDYPLTDKILSSRQNLIKWLIDIHNIVNLETGKKEMNYNDVMKQYIKLYNPNNLHFRIYVILLFFFIMIIVFCFVYYKQKFLLK